MRQIEVSVEVCPLECCADEFCYLWETIGPLFAEHDIRILEYIEDDYSIDMTISGDIDGMNHSFTDCSIDISSEFLYIEIQEKPQILIRYTIDDEDEMYWIVMKKDDALLGLKKGKQSQETIAGPYFDQVKALDAMAKLSRLTKNSWFTVVKSKEKPERTELSFEVAEEEKL